MSAQASLSESSEQAAGVREVREDRLTFFGRAWARFYGPGYRALGWATRQYQSARDHDACDWVIEHWLLVYASTTLLVACYVMLTFPHNPPVIRQGNEAVKIVAGDVIEAGLMSLFLGAALALVNLACLCLVLAAGEALFTGLRGLWAAMACASLFVTVALGCALYVVPVAALTTLQFLALTPLVVVQFGQFRYLAHRGVFHTCPQGECSYRGQPLHVCLTCERAYPRLWPNVYGHLYHICGQCGTKLPTLDSLGRRKLERRCARCGEVLTGESLGKLPERLVAIVGANFSGATCYTMMLLRELTRGDSDNPLARAAEIDSPETQEWWQHEGQRLERGEIPDKTPEGVPQALTLRLRHKGGRHLLHLYDAAAEEYASTASFSRHEHMRYVDGLVLIVDPFGLPGIRDRLDERALSMYDFLIPLEDIVDPMVVVLNRMRGTTGGRRHRVPLAVVINKADTEPVKTELGDVAESPPDSKRCRQALLDWGAGPAIRVIENNVSEVRYFACSALGREADPDGGSGEPFEGYGVLEPLAWILARRGRR